jgi:DNA polymerase-3 subunit gamma/tau
MARKAPAREAAPARAAATARPGVINTDTLRQRWPDVLDAVKRESRVAWILLNAASVDSLEGGVLTVAFAREGEAKGFASSGHDQVLIGVLALMLGLNVRVRAIAHGGPGPRTTVRPAPADPAPGDGGRAGSPGGATDRPDESTGEPGVRGGAGRAGRATPDNQASARGRQASAGGLGGTAAAGGPGRRASAGPRNPEPRAGGGPGSPNSPAAADLEQEWPDDAGPADAGAGPTGMELIERHLGGTVIEEIEEP